MEVGEKLARKTVLKIVGRVIFIVSKKQSLFHFKYPPLIVRLPLFPQLCVVVVVVVPPFLPLSTKDFEH